MIRIVLLFESAAYHYLLLFEKEMAVKEDTLDMIDPPEGYDARTNSLTQLSSAGMQTAPATN